MPLPIWPPPGYLTTSQVADRLGVTPQHVRVLLRTLGDRDRLHTAAGWLIRDRAVAHLQRRNTRRGRPVGWRKAQREDEE